MASVSGLSFLGFEAHLFYVPSGPLPVTALCPCHGHFPFCYADGERMGRGGDGWWGGRGRRKGWVEGREGWKGVEKGRGGRKGGVEEREGWSEKRGGGKRMAGRKGLVEGRDGVGRGGGKGIRREGDKEGKE